MGVYMAANLTCSQCGNRFRAEPRMQGFFPEPTFLAHCPTCGAACRIIVPSSPSVPQVTPDPPARRTTKDRVTSNRVLEYWVQQYVANNHQRLGFQDFKGPFDTGPDFQVLHDRKWVDAEVEVTWRSYLWHKHHEDSRWDACVFLIVLSEAKPDAAARKLLPRNILHLDKDHFAEWYREAATAYWQECQRNPRAPRSPEPPEDGGIESTEMPFLVSLPCSDCRVTYHIHTTEVPGFADLAPFHCPRCQKGLGNIRVDTGGFEIVGQTLDGRPPELP